MKTFKGGSVSLVLTLRLQTQWIPKKWECPQESNAEGTKMRQLSSWGAGLLEMDLQLVLSPYRVRMKPLE